MKNTAFSNLLSPRIFVALALLSVSETVHAQTAWDGGGGDSDYSNALNWAGDVIPGNANTNGALIGSGATQTVIYNTATSYTSTGTAKANSLLVGTGASGVGSLTLSGSAGTLTFGGDGYTNAAFIGSTNGATATTGTVMVSAGKLAIGTGVGSDASINLGVSTDNTAGAKSGTLIINGGTVEVGRRILMGANNAATTGVLTISSGTLDMKRTGSNAEGDLGMIRLGAGTNTVNLDGGTAILTGFNTTAASNARSNIYFNSTTLRSNAANTDFISGVTGNANYQIKNGGLIMDTNTFAVTINDALSNFTGHNGLLSKVGTGTLTLSAANTYTGATTVNAGTLALGSGGNLGATAVTVNSPGTFAVVQTASSTSNGITGSIALNAGSAFTMADTFASTLNVTGASTLAPASGDATTLTFDIVGAASDNLAITGAATVGAAGARINIAPTTTAIAAGDYTVISAASGLGANFSLSNTLLPNAGGLYTLSLANSTASAEIVTVAADANALYWKGAGTAWDTAANWTTDQAGTIVSGSAPSSSTNVAFSAASPANLTTNTLTAPLTVNSVNFLPGAGAVTVATSANALTINGGGITNASANAMTINNPIALGAAQTWTNSGVGLLTIGGGINNDANLLTVSGTGNTTISGIIGTGATKTGGLTKTGAGTLTLSSGASSYTGNINITGGTLLATGTTGGAAPATSPLGNPGTAGRTITVGSGAVLSFGNNDILGNDASNTAVKLIVNGGTITNNGNFFTTLNAVDLNGGTINSIGGANPSFPSFRLKGTITVGGSAVSTISGSGSNSHMQVFGTIFNVADAVSGSASDLNVSVVLQGTSLTKSGVGTMTLSAANTYTGNTTVTAGTLQINGSYTGNSTAVASLLLIGNANTTNGNVIIGSGAGTLSFGGDGFSSAAQVGTNGGTGTLTINGGITNISGASGQTAALNIAGMSAGGTGTVTVNSGTLNIGNRILMSSNAGTASGTLTINGGAVNVGYSGGLANGNQQGVLRMGGGTSAVNLNGGSLSLFAFQKDGTNTATTVINFNGGTLKALGSPSNFFSANDANSLVSTNFTTNVKAGGAIIDTNNFNITIPTALVFDPSSTGGGLTKQNTGTLTLSGANTYTGVTTVSAGRLVVNGSTTSNTTVLANATLGGSGTITGNVSGAGNVAPGNSIGTLTVAGTYNITGLQQFEVAAGLGAFAPSDEVIGISTLTYGGTLQVIADSGSFTAGDSWDLFDFTSQSGLFANNTDFGVLGGGGTLPTLGATQAWNFDYSQGVLSVQAIPEPSTVVLGGLALIGFASVGLRRRKRIN